VIEKKGAQELIFENLFTDHECSLKAILASMWLISSAARRKSVFLALI